MTVTERQTLESLLRERLAASIALNPRGLGEYDLDTPFQFTDGDHYVIRLRETGDGGYELRDAGHTFMHLSYFDIDLDTPIRQRIIENALARARVTNDEGELRLQVSEEQIAEGLFSFVQAITQVSDVEYLKREYARSTFLDDLRKALEEMVPPVVRAFDWHDEERDPEGKYPVDCRVEGPTRPLFVFGILNDDHCRDATITIGHFLQYYGPFGSMAVHQNQEAINRRVLARFSDVVGKQFSSLAGNEAQVGAYIEDFLHVA